MSSSSGHCQQQSKQMSQNIDSYHIIFSYSKFNFFPLVGFLLHFGLYRKQNYADSMNQTNQLCRDANRFLFAFLFCLDKCGLACSRGNHPLVYGFVLFHLFFLLVMLRIFITYLFSKVILNLIKLKLLR